MSCGGKDVRIAIRCGRMCICSGISSTSRSSASCCVPCAGLDINWSARMFQTNSLRFRVAFYYALFGAGLSILLSGVVYFTVEQLGHRLMDQILLVELYEHASEEVFEPPNTASIKGYVLSATQTSPDIPAEIKALEPGSHNITIGSGDYRALVADLDGARYFMLFDSASQHLQETRFVRFVIFFAIFMIVSSSIGGVILASRVTSSVSRLAKE